MIYARIYITITKTLRDKQSGVGTGHRDPIKQGLAKFSLLFFFLFKSQIISSSGFVSHTSLSLLLQSAIVMLKQSQIIHKEMDMPVFQ